jgi:hypothetical protein
VSRATRGVAMAAALLLTACLAEPSPTASPPPSAEPTAVPTASPAPSAVPTASAAPTPTPESSLSLEPPEAVDDRVVAVDVATNVAAGEDGTIQVTVTSAADTRIDELVLRWPTALADTLFLAPFTPSDDRTRDGGPPLVQPWTKWVVGPGERGEPAGTTSLGWGPLLAGATLEIPIVVTRRADGPVAFDLQVLAGESLLTLDDGELARLRIEVP